MFAKSLFLLGLFAFTSVQGETALADESFPLKEAKRERELAEMRYRQYVQVDYPLEQLRLDARITLQEAEIDSVRRRLDEYEPMNRLRGSNPLFTDIENLRLTLLELELQKEILCKERCFLRAARRDRLRQLQLEVEAASDLVDSLAETLSEE